MMEQGKVDEDRLAKIEDELGSLSVFMIDAECRSRDNEEKIMRLAETVCELHERVFDLIKPKKRKAKVAA